MKFFKLIEIHNFVDKKFFKLKSEEENLGFLIENLAVKFRFFYLKSEEENFSSA
jgi:hypothetical protein